MKRNTSFGAIVLASTVALAGCGDDEAPPAAAPAPPTATPTGGPRNRNRNRGDAATEADASLPALTVTDNSFVESGQVRDPFRSYAEVFRTDGTVVNQDTRSVALSNYSLDDLRLVAVVLGTDSPYAMVVDPTRRGTILRRGVLVGRPEMIHSNTENRNDYAVHWRVARVLPSRLRRGPDGQMFEVPAELVLERPDPLNPTAQVVERSLPLAGNDQASAVTSTGAVDPSAVGALPPGLGGGGPAYLPSNLGGGGPSGPPGGPGVPGAAPGGGRIVPPTPAGVRGAVGAPPPPQQTTVIVQAPPAQQAVQPMAVPTTPPPVVITGGESPLR
ncbi:MAG: hypothetical protein JNK72_05820 [Myxococcales bacterium]|nr:hypothetical protein [Myxococcales bacterium]